MNGPQAAVVVTRSTDGLDIALAHAHLGRRVFPWKPIPKPGKTKPDKKPLVLWQDHATDDEATIIRWWKRWPDALAGWRLPEGLGVVDLDDRDAFRASGLELPAAPEQSGTFARPDGLHRLYVVTDGRQTQGELPGADTRVGGDGWVALYSPEAFAGDPGPAPDWFPRARRVDTGSKIFSIDGPHVARVAIAEGRLFIPAGRRDGDVASIAGTLIESGATAAATTVALQLLDAAGAIEQPVGDELRDFDRIAESVARTHRKRHPEAAGAPRRPVLTWTDLMAEPAEPPPTIRPGVPKAGVTVLAAPPKAGKTLAAGQWALESGLPVLMVIEEGSLAGISYRLRTQAAALGIVDPPVRVWHRQRMRLDDRESLARLQDAIEDAALVIVDPLNRLHSADENKPSEMTRVMDGLADLAPDRAVLAIHHLNKPSAERRGDPWDRFRGASSIRSGTDANLIMDGTGDRIHLIGEFRDAEPLSEWMELDRESLIFRPAEAPEAPAKVDPLGLRAYVEARGQVNGQQVQDEFKVSKNTAFAALRALGCDEYSGPRGRLTFSLGTGQ